jgi:regulator of ribosome biosynthesis
MLRSLFFDLGNLLAYDLITPERDEMNQVCVENVTTLYAKALTLPRADAFLNLPAPTMILPRERAPPEEKPTTRFEKFRLKKGLPAKRKRTHLQYDETVKDWVPRYGGYSSKKIAAKGDWIIEDKNDGEDPFAAKGKTKAVARLKEQKN